MKTLQPSHLLVQRGTQGSSGPLPNPLATGDLIRGSRIVQHAPRPACVNGSSGVVAKPSSPRRMACSSCACQAGKPSGRSSADSCCSIAAASAPGPAAHQQQLPSWGLWAIWCGSTYYCPSTHPHVHTLHGTDVPVQYFTSACRCASPPHVRVGTPDRNEYPVHVLTAARPADMMTQLEAGRGCERRCRRRSVHE